MYAYQFTLQYGTFIGEVRKKSFLKATTKKMVMMIDNFVKKKTSFRRADFGVVRTPVSDRFGHLFRSHSDTHFGHSDTWLRVWALDN